MSLILPLLVVAIAAAGGACSSRPSVINPDAASRDNSAAALDRSRTAPPTLWAHFFSSDAVVTLMDMAVDSHGTVYLVGSFSGRLAIGIGALDAGNSVQPFIIRIPAAGDRYWARDLRCTDSGEITSIAMDDNDVPHVLGQFKGTCTFENGQASSIGPQDLFIATLTEHGALLDAASAGTGKKQAGAIVTSSGGNSYIAATVHGPTTLGAFALTPSGTRSLVVARLAASTQFDWATVAAGDEIDVADAAIDISLPETIYVTGTFREATFGATTLTAPPNCGDFLASAPFVAKLSAQGAFLATTTLEGGCTARINGVVARAGELDLTGMYAGTLSLGGVILTAKGARDMFLARISSAGVTATTFGGTGESGPGAIASGLQRSLYAATSYTGTFAVSGETVHAKAERDCLVMRVDSNGTADRVTSSESDGSCTVRRVATHAGDHVYVTGALRGATSFAGLQVTPSGSSGIFVWKLAY